MNPGYTVGMTAKLLLVDTETGGRNPTTHSLLTVYAAIVDGISLKIIKEHHWKVKPDDGIFKVTAGGLEVNKINLIQHSKEAQNYTLGSRRWNTEFLEFIWRPNEEPIRIFGHNVHYDVTSITSAIGPDWQENVSRRQLDTAAIGLFLQNSGLLPEKGLEELSLQGLANHFGISHETLHDAKTDALLTLEVYRRFRSMILNKELPNIK